MKHVRFSTEWLGNLAVKSRTEIADSGCKGLILRTGPTSKAFFRWAQIRDPATGVSKRQRIKLGNWPTLGLAEARAMVGRAGEEKHAELSADLTVAQLAEVFRRDVLSHQERGGEAWNIVKVHIVEAQPDPKRPAFGAWPARTVRPADVASVVRYAAQPRTVGNRQLGGAGVARVVLRDLKAVFAHAVETGSIEMTPAGVLRAQSFGLRAVSRRRFLDAEELKAFFQAIDLTALLDGTAKPQRLSAVVRLAIGFQLYVPLRSHSLIGARKEEIDWEARLWTVPVDRLKLHKQERAEARAFVVPIPETAVTILRRLCEISPESPWVLSSPLDPAKHVEAKALVRALARLQGAGRLALGSKLTVHDLRRTWRALAQDLGVDAEVAERTLGHTAALRGAGFGGAADVYGRGQMVERRAQAAELVGSALDRIRLGASATVVPLASRSTP